MPDLIAELTALDAHYRRHGGSVADVIERCGVQFLGYPPLPAEERDAAPPERERWAEPGHPTNLFAGTPPLPAEEPAEEPAFVVADRTYLPPEA